MKKNSKTCSTSTCGLKGWVFLFLVVVLIVGGVMFWREQVGAPRGASSEKSAVLPEAPPSTVAIKKLKDGERLVVNEEAGYEVKVGSDMYLYSDKMESSDLVIQDYKEPADGYGGLPGCKVFVAVEEGNLSNIEKEVEQECIQDTDCERHSFFTKNYGNFGWKEIKYFGQFVGSGNPEYKIENDDKIVSLYFQCDEESFISEVLENFTF
ncbi:MAG: hypothetical protein CO030_02410 [Candidatus Magasanikbacteria bacterium CG_4_9_14_0_2_um_filter_42_11]|uniref:Uncharacterized protein n=1 Tax=Candidatus Magasanikbacteria bacterium CG_4_9_14_0_2_um_filter_42_11 TaxID=1974643 RepID=A0A2M8FA35_9BACT|nr:MAG: hypothetical protein COU34_04495 [Candidatus Magasanikbacteria bacterium CG10_big_fil_rev_8_21_14_0_10_43_9]PIY92624.1 MAG: hypothetical protein COY70_02235 [Candidatus Magasanikbacteria bacterium CG_4_10_14_0_8_um_filter_42_12]PJC52529.1 MAG: hypothetical protein CO030_02410 [Candidatus Magasanikbacteria bacterium CG_4_9_14_0_2_um_filter_42_11]